MVIYNLCKIKHIIQRLVINKKSHLTKIFNNIALGSTSYTSRNTKYKEEVTKSVCVTEAAYNLYSINVLPIGGDCQTDQYVSKHSRNYEEHKYWKNPIIRIIILAGTPNLITSIISSSGNI